MCMVGGMGPACVGVSTMLEGNVNQPSCSVVEESANKQRPVPGSPRGTIMFVQGELGGVMHVRHRRGVWVPERSRARRRS